MTLTKPQVTAAYSRVAPLYDLWARFTETRARERGLALADIRDGERVLEVAVGTGLAFEEILRRNPNGLNEGIDLTEGMLARARAKAERSAARNWRLRTGDAYALDFPDASFDLVLNDYMFDLLPEADFPKVIGEFRRVLAPGGRLVLVNLARADTLAYAAWHALWKAAPSLVGGCRGVDVAAPLEAAGFKVETREFVSQWGFPSEAILARK